MHRSPDDAPARRRAFAPAIVLLVGALATWTLPRPRPVPLRQPLATLPTRLANLAGTDVEVPAEQIRVAGVSSYLFRAFPIDSLRKASLYVGYYASQVGAAEMHTPDVCLPGSGWYPVASGTTSLLVDGTPVTVNRYVIENGSNQALVYYWFQGRGRILADARTSRSHVFWDGVIRHRTDEALVRIIIPLGRGTPSAPVVAAPADRLAETMAAQVIPALGQILPPASL